MHLRLDREDSVSPRNSAAMEYGISESYFFEEDYVIVTVNTDRYCVILESILEPNLNELDEMVNIRLQKDRTAAHSCRQAIGKEMFHGHLITLRGDIG